MPRRPRAHQVGDLALRALYARLPGEFAIRTKESDYGIDAEVEVFEPMPENPQDAQATGVLFDVQSKGTDDEIERDALAVRLNVSTINYFGELNRPVLITRYMTATKQLYVKWFHSYDPGYLREDQETATVRLTAEDAWTDETPVRLAEEATAYHHLRTSSLALPLMFRLVVDEDVQGSQQPTPTELLLELQSLREAAPVLRYSNDNSNPAGLTLHVTADSIRAELAGVTTATLKFEDGSPTVDRIAYNAGLAIALALDSAGRVAEASRLLLLTVENSSFLNNVEVCIRLGSILYRSHRLQDSLRIARRLWERTDVAEDSADAFIWPAFVQSSAMSDDQGGEFEAVMQARFVGSQQRGDTYRAAGAAYSLANLHLGKNRFQAALRHYRLAAGLDPSYVERPYYWEDLGGLLFLVGRYRLSADAYAQAIALGSRDSITTALYADALLFSGRYADAAEVMTRNCDRWTVGSAHYHLALELATYLAQVPNWTTQRRRPTEASGVVSAAVEHEPSQVQLRCEQALALDALCADAWYNLGIAYKNEAIRRDDAARLASAEFCFMAAGLCATGDLDSWATVFFLASALGSPRLPFLFESAYRLHGGDYIRRLIEFRRADGVSNSEVEDFAGEIDSRRNALREEPSIATIRMATGPEYKEILFGTLFD